MLPAIRDLDVPVVLVNVQKIKALDYEHTDIASWLGEGYACGAVGEAVADLERAGKRHAVITGVVEGGDPAVQAEIEDWCKAAQVRRRFRETNIAQIGRPYPGMMDLYIDETNLYNRMFLYTKQFDWEKMWAIADDITDEEAKDFPSRVNANDECFLSPENMTKEVQDYCRRTGQQVPETLGEIATVIYTSLADCYAKIAKEIEEMTGRTYSRIHIVGGGSNAGYLNELTAKATKKEIHAGPGEATAIGNITAQMLKAEEFKTIEEARTTIHESFGIKVYKA